MKAQLLSNDVIYWLAAMRLPHIGPVRFCRLLEVFTDIKELFSATEKALQQAGLKPQEIDVIKKINWQSVDVDLAWSEKNHCQLISLADDRYPKLLREIHAAPLLLFVRGDVGLLSMPQLAIVGSRNPTHAGMEMAMQFAECLARSGLAITSGLAFGIDAASHRGALRAKGKTLAVCGTGLNHIYPASHRKLAEEIILHGALISEFPPDTPPIAKNFPQRNRIISGLSLGVLVVEAAMKSGSLITARSAVEQGRDVFALPGSIHNPLTRGCHHLIRQGAKLVETAADVLEELSALHAVLTQYNEPVSSSSVQKDLGVDQWQLLQQVDYDVTPLDVIGIRSGLTASKVSSILLELELAGCVQVVPGGYRRVFLKTS